MPSTCRFMDLYKGENEWLAGEKPTDLEDLGAWHIEWAKLRKDCEHQILFVEEQLADLVSEKLRNLRITFD